MKRSLLSLLFLGILGISFAQDTDVEIKNKDQVEKKSTDFFKPYIGFQGGYLFKNKNQLENPLWHLNDGSHIELNFGFKKDYFGWDASLGYLRLNRSSSEFEKLQFNSQMIYDGADTSSGDMRPGPVVSGLENNSLYVEPEHQTFEHKPFQGFYLMTGPSLWLGKNKFKVNLGLEAGLGFSQIGYYFVAGERNAANGSVDFKVDNGSNLEDYTLKADNIQYRQYGMTQKYYDKLQASNFDFNTKQALELHFISRASLNLEYFVIPQVSLHLGGNFWYIGTPKMNGNQELNGTSSYEHDSGRFTKHLFDYKDGYDNSDLMHFSANAGLKYWFGTNKTSKSGSGSNSEQNNIKASDNKNVKELKVQVIDKKTKTPISDALVSIKNIETNRSFEISTSENGIATLERLPEGNYNINGSIHSISTSSEKITTSDFNTSAPDIFKTIYYDDNRFILKGVTLDAINGRTEKEVKVNLEKGSEKVSSTVSNEDGNFQFVLEGNSDYQVQGLKHGFYSNIESVSTKGLNRSQTLYVKLQLGLNTVELGKSFVIENILYDFDDDAIRADAAIELDRLVAFLQENPNVRIELSSHTDSRGNNAYNLALSQRRARSAVNYLISKGINKNRLEAKGYGETRLINRCKDGVTCSESEHQANRRTEIEIIK